MGVVGFAALIANGGVALMLYRFRSGDANMRSVWICSRNDAIGNLAVLLAAMGVFGTGTGWPDVIVAAIMGGLGLWGGWQIVRQARGELRAEHDARSVWRRSRKPMTESPSDQSLACCLSAGEYQNRLAWIEIPDAQSAAKPRARRFGAAPCLRAGSRGRGAENG